METAVGTNSRLQMAAEEYFAENSFMNKRVIQDIIHVRYRYRYLGDCVSWKYFIIYRYRTER